MCDALCSQDGESPLHKCVLYDHEACAKVLLAAGARVDATDAVRAEELRL